LKPIKPIAKFMSPPRILVVGFALIILLGACLLSLPIAAAGGERLRFLDALFTATSATCVTGLVVVDTGTFFTTFGQIVIISLIQVGGLGFMTMATLIALALRRKITIKERLILQEAMNQGSMEGIVRLIRRVIVYSLFVEVSAAILLSIRFSVDLGLRKGIYFGIFHAISLFNNAGFDLFGEFHSLTDYVNDVVVNVVAVSLIVIGGIGFVVIADIVELKQKQKLTLHSKVVLTTTAVLILVGTFVIFIFEFTNQRTLGSLNAAGKVLASLFQSVASRTAGANTLDIAGLRQASQFFIILLMFVGASPGSTGGGIKTTTFATIIGAVIAMIRGKEEIVFFNYRVGQERINKAITLSLFAIALVIAVTMLLSATEDVYFLTILFEATSAFSTTGLSMGLTPHLSDFGKLVIALTMFAGRLGPITLAYALGPKKEKELFKHPEGKIIIG
jgi:trk system potassium uptake protein